MLVSDLIALVDRLAPFDLAEPWDRVGLQAGSARTEVERVLVTLDVTSEALDEAARADCQAILAHHPLVFEPLAAVTDDAWPGAAVARLLREGRSLVVAHTNVDKARGGLADIVAGALGLEAIAPLEPARVEWSKLVGFVPEDDAEAVRRAVFAAGAGVIGAYVHCSFSLSGQGTFFGTEGTAPVAGEAGRDQTTDELRLEVVFPRAKRRAVLDAFAAAHSYEEPAFDVYPVENEVRSLGLGRVGLLPSPRPVGVMARAVAGLFGLPAARFSGDPDRVVASVAVVPGSGGSTIDAAVAAGADALVTGDVKYHDAERAARAGLALIDVPHEICEGWAFARWAARLADELRAEAADSHREVKTTSGDAAATPRDASTAARDGVELTLFAPSRPLWQRVAAQAGAAGPAAERLTVSPRSREGAAMHSRDDQHLHLYVDGGARGNPGPAGIGGRLLSLDGTVVEEFSDRIGTATNNVAEYQALITGLEMALDRGVRKLTVFSDSELIVKQLNGQYKVKDANLRLLFDQARALVVQFQEIDLRNVPREQNTAADRLVNEALDAG